MTMKKKVLMVLLAATLSVSMIAGCGSKGDNNTDTTKTESKQDSDQEAADKVAKLIDDIYVQERTDKTDEQCTAAKEAWDALTDAQKELVEGENADPDYFGRDTGDASKDDPLNADEIGENEILVVSFGTSFNDSRATDIGGIEKAVQAAYPDWSVRRAFTAQVIINHVQARDGEKIDNVDQALQRAVDNGVKNLVVQPTHLMHGAEYDEMTEAIDGYKDKFESVAIAEPMLGEVGDDATVINDDKKAVAQAITDEAVKEAYEFAIENGITYTQSLGFMAGEMKAATLKLMMRGVKAKPTLALGRTKEQAQMLYDESCKSLGEGESKKRYVPRALNIILKKEKFSFDMVIEALRTIPSSEVTMAKLADCGEKEACIAGALISWILTLQRQKETKTAA